MEIEFSQVQLRLPNSRADLFRIPELKISRGEKVLIQGPSGRGKTTLLHLMAGLLMPDEGHIQIRGTELARLSEGARARFRREHFGMIFQRLNLLEHLTAAENVQLGSRTASQEEISHALTQVGLGGRERARTSVLSLGEQQRVAVARVLVARPEILLADEPTSSLDQSNANRVLDLLFEAVKDRTLVLVSHDLRVADRFPTHYDFNDWVTT